MERLTILDGIGQNELARCMGCGPEKAGAELENCGYCEEGWQKALKKLAAYEDTGLEPEEVSEILIDKAVVETNLKQYEDACGDISISRLRELSQADREGRCVVLPFKPPRWVYVCSTRFPKPAQAHYASAINVLQDMDKGCVFGDTQEEAAAALRREQDG